MTHKEIQIWAEMARRKNQFHPKEKWQDIKLWGLFNWSMVSELIKRGDLKTDMKKENKTVWVIPSADAYKKHIEPILHYSNEKLLQMAGWK